jgi:hypothetical protein
MTATHNSKITTKTDVLYLHAHDAPDLFLALAVK